MYFDSFQTDLLIFGIICSPLIVFSFIVFVLVTISHVNIIWLLGTFSIQINTSEIALDTWMRNFCFWKRLAHNYRIQLDPTPAPVPAPVPAPDPAPKMFAYHPHGHVGAGLFIGMHTNACKFNEIYGEKRLTMVSNYLLFYPIIGFFAHLIGFIQASKEMVNKAFRNGYNILVIPGGVREQYVNGRDRKAIRLVLKNRKGFIRLAIQNGAEIVPCFGFGETQMYSEAAFLSDTRHSIYERFHIPTALPVGKYNSLFPHTPKEGINVVCGKGFILPKIKEPEDYIVDAYHAKYIKELKRLYNQHKERYNHTDIPLYII